MNDNTINIRQIQHYMYCLRRFALLELNDDWSELILSVMDGKSFSEITHKVSNSGRKRTGLDFRAPGFGERVFSRSEVEIIDVPNYWKNCKIVRDEFVLDDSFGSRG